MCPLLSVVKTIEDDEHMIQEDRVGSQSNKASNSVLEYASSAEV